jgi:hypothetical protein
VEPAGLEQVQASGASEQSLWNKAPAWRNLIIAASFLTLAAMVLPTLLPAPQAPAPLERTSLPQHEAAAAPVSVAPPQHLAPAPAAPHHVHRTHLAASAPAPAAAPSSSVCALHQPAAPLPMGYGVIIGLEDPDFSRADVARREARLGGAIDPHYLGDLRAVVRQDGGRVQAFDVPRGMAVHVGDHVTLQNSYRSADQACSYIPILVTADSGPPTDQAPP